MGYKTKALKGISWMALLQLLSRLVSIVKIAIIARILTPLDFGLFGMVILVVGISEIFSDFGIQPFLIQYKRDLKDYANSIWSLQIIRGIILLAFILLISIPASLFFKQSSLLFLISLASLNPLIKGFENVYVVNFQKELYFNKEFVYKLIIVTSDFIVSVVLTLITHSVTALIIGMLSSSFIAVLYSWLALKEKPAFKFDFRKIKEILRYGKWFSLNSTLYYFTLQLDSLVVGRSLGALSLGFYQIAQKFSFIPMKEVSDIFGKVSFPVYAKISGDLSRFKKAYLETLTGLIFIQFFIALFLYIFSKEIITLLLGPKWILTEGLFKIFIIYGFISAILGTNGSFFLSVGRQDILTKLSMIRFFLLIPLMLIFLKIWGIQGIVYSLILSVLILIPISLALIYLLLNRKIKTASAV